MFAVLFNINFGPCYVTQLSSIYDHDFNGEPLVEYTLRVQLKSKNL